MQLGSAFRAIARYVRRRLGNGSAQRTAAFREIYARNAWGSNESVSGRGSEMGYTSNLRVALPKLFRQLNIRSLLDAPCGDFNWMSGVDLAGIRYLGVDIVAELVESNRRRYARDGVEFRVLDIVSERVPQVDLVICRHCFIHLSNNEVREAISNFCQSRSTWLLTTHSAHLDRNDDIDSGSFRLLNLEQPPFNFPLPQQLIKDEPTATECVSGYLGLWRLAELENAGCQR